MEAALSLMELLEGFRHPRTARAKTTAYYLVRVMCHAEARNRFGRESGPGQVAERGLARIEIHISQRVFRGFTSRSRAALRLHPGVRHGALRRRWCEWEQPHTLSWRSAFADDAEWMYG